ncbi:MAG: GntR family transcriptional regulator, partial [Eubacterium sp.]
MDGKKNQTIKYQQIADDLRLKILGGIYAKNEMLLSEKKLCEKYNVSRLTIRNTLNLLENEGYIYTKAGKGSFVKAVSNDTYQIDMDIDAILNNGYDKVKLIKAKMIKPDIDLVYELKVSRDSKIVYMDWSILKEERVIGYDRRFIPYFRGLPIDEKDLTYTGLKEMIKSFYSDFREEMIIN